MMFLSPAPTPKRMSSSLRLNTKLKIIHRLSSGEINPPIEKLTSSIDSALSSKYLHLEVLMHLVSNF